MNARKKDHEDVIDPFKLPASSVFTINFVDGSISVHPSCGEPWRGRARKTIKRLKLDDLECRKLRRDHAHRIISGKWNMVEAEATSPFVFGCLRDQGLLP